MPMILGRGNQPSLTGLVPIVGTVPVPLRAVPVLLGMFSLPLGAILVSPIMLFLTLLVLLFVLLWLLLNGAR